MKKENYEIDRSTEAEFEAAKIENLGVEFTPGAFYNVDGHHGMFVREESERGRPKYIFKIEGVERVIDFDFYYLISKA